MLTAAAEGECPGGSARGSARGSAGRSPATGRSPTTGRSPATGTDRGSVLIIVLWIALGLVSLALYFGHAMMLEYRTRFQPTF